MEEQGHSINYLTIDAFAKLIEEDDEDTVILDTRSMLEYNTNHVISAYHVNSSKIVMRRLEQDKVC